MRDPSERLRDILAAIEQIERYASRGRDVFFEDEPRKSHRKAAVTTKT